MDLLTSLIAFGAGAGAYKLLDRLREHRTAPTGLADVLGWGFLVGEGVILQKDGSFLAGWKYRGPDLGASTAKELDVLSEHVADALRPYGDNWMFHVDAVRRRTALAHTRHGLVEQGRRAGHRLPVAVRPDLVLLALDRDRNAALGRHRSVRRPGA